MNVEAACTFTAISTLLSAASIEEIEPAAANRILTIVTELVGQFRPANNSNDTLTSTLRYYGFPPDLLLTCIKSFVRFQPVRSPNFLGPTLRVDSIMSEGLEPPSRMFVAPSLQEFLRSGGH
ncbi:hypothetical protein GMRT_13592 [Giardia muris]|uniref:Uncharacterized protein n=1 Tax=Giardia muris TaxID=5742 RepID=A0A4Z1SVY8_GIAMU|nr:hypothetical protein GMRT_13592 [Giardia muris]|eukprot:TNJ30012.1 hypothetical protein GMRT_13592 [Giardia muris]